MSDVKELKGIQASPGKVKGRAIIIKSPKDLSKMQEGGIIVCPFSNPYYTPAMVMASGMVTDKGGSTSHAAIVARELGIPCVVNTEKATQILKDGTEVFIDGRGNVIYK